MAARDYYADLGVSRDASPEEIGRAFRKRAARDHPDRNPGDAAAEARFKNVAEAYNVLHDAKSRASYDQGGHVRVEDFETPDEIFRHFEDLFGGRVRRSRRGEDHDVELTISPEEALRGGRRSFLATASWTEPRPRTVEVSIPPGVNDGTILRLKGMGAPGTRGGAAGDLRIHIRIRADGPLEREVTVDVLTAILGGTVRVPLPEGTAEVTVPPGTQPGQKLRLRGQGLADGAGRRGDVLVSVHVRIPNAMSAEERRLFEELRRISQ